MLILPRILAFYVQLVVAPVNLCADYGGESIRHLSLPTALAALLGVAAAALLGARRDRRLLFAYAMILLPLVPVANVVPIFRPFADRYLYFPLAGVALALACLGDAPWMVSRVRRLALAFGLVAVVVLALACRQRQRVWADSLTLWSDTFAKNPGSPTAAINAAMAFSDAGRLGEAEFAAQRAIVLTGGNALSFFAHLALILDKQGRPDVARRALEKALELPLMADPEALVDRLYMEPVDAQRYRELLEKQGMLTARTSSE
jgi:tetratricopeptide (TPR) repeat protein